MEVLACDMFALNSESQPLDEVIMCAVTFQVDTTLSAASHPLRLKAPKPLQRIMS